MLVSERLYVVIDTLMTLNRLDALNSNILKTID